MTTRHTLFIVIEGLDGSGKSTCAERLARELDAVHMRTPDGSLRAARNKILEEFSGNQEAAQLLYLASIFDADAKIRAHLRQGRSVVLDRYLLSTLAYAAFRGSRLSLDHLGHQIVPATATFFLDAPLKTRKARLSSRGLTTDDRETLTADADRALLAQHRSRQHDPYIGRWVEVDASRHSDEVVASLAGLMTT